MLAEFNRLGVAVDAQVPDGEALRIGHFGSLD
jgi:hypothetical protein